MCYYLYTLQALTVGGDETETFRVYGFEERPTVEEEKEIHEDLLVDLGGAKALLNYSFDRERVYEFEIDGNGWDVW